MQWRVVLLYLIEPNKEGLQGYCMQHVVLVLLVAWVVSYLELEGLFIKEPFFSHSVNVSFSMKQ